MYLVPALNIRELLGADWWSSSCFSNVAEKCMRRTAADVLRCFSNNWKWKDSHFHRERVSKPSRMQAGPSIVSEEKEGSANFTVEFYGSLYNIRFSAALWTLSIHLFYVESIIDYPPANDCFTIMISDRRMLAEALISWGWIALRFIAARKRKQLQFASEL